MTNLGAEIHATEKLSLESQREHKLTSQLSGYHLTSTIRTFIFSNFRPETKNKPYCCPQIFQTNPVQLSTCTLQVRIHL